MSETTEPSPSTAFTVNIRKVLRASPRRVFRAWTEADQLRRWFAAGEGYTTPLAEVDLRVGGRFRVGMLAPGSDQMSVASGVYQEIVQDTRLVLAWRWEHEGPSAPTTRLTLEFRPHPDGTELVLVHEGLTDATMREQHAAGWQGCLNSLARTLAQGDANP